MNKWKIPAAVFSAAISSAICMCCSMSVFAADASEGSGVSKGLMAFIMIAVFIVSAAAAGFVTFRIRTRKINEAAKKDEASHENSPGS